MSKNGFFVGLSERNSTVLCGGLTVFVCLIVRVALSPDVALKTADIQLTVNSSAIELDSLARRLKEQAKIIEEKELAYRELQETYEEFLENRKGAIDLGKKIEAIDRLPSVGNINEIETEISEVEEELLEVSK